MKVFLSIALAVLVACAASAEEVAEPPVCEPGVEFYPDPTDCTKFYQCSEGTPLLKECSPGLYWNAALNTCDFPQASGCVVSTSTTDPVTSTTSDGSTTPTTTPNSTVTTSGTTVPTSVTTSLTTAPTTGTTTGTTGASSSTTTGTSGSSTTGLPTESTTGTGTSGSSTTGLPTESTTGTGTSGSTTTGLPTESTTGTGTSSSSTTGIPTESTTGTGTSGSTTTGIPTEEPPTEQTTISTSTSTQEPSTEPPGGLPESCPAVDDPLNIVRLPHESNCEYYYRCTSGVKVVYSCPSSSAHFSPTLRICQDPNVAGCDRCPPVEDISHVVRLPHETDCHLYYLCEDGKKTLYQCRVDWQFSRNVRECLEAEQAKCTLRK